MLYEKTDLLKELQDYYDSYCNEIREEAGKLQDKSMPPLPEEKFALFEMTGNRLIYEEDYFLRRRFLAVFGLKAILDGEKKDIEKLEEVILSICEEECWALPAHVRRDEDKNWRIYVDLFAAETAQTLSEIRFLLKDKLSETVKERAKEEVLTRVLNPFYESPVPYVHWEHAHNNWCAVCGGSVGSAAIYLLQDEPEKLKKLLIRICNSLRGYYLEGFTADGVCPEGLGYFTYGMTYFVGFADQLYDFTAGKTDLFCEEKLEKIARFQAKCYFQSGKTVCFSDGFTEDTFKVGLSCYLAMKYPGAAIPPMKQAGGLFDDHCYRFMGLYRNLTWTKRYMELLAASCGGEEGRADTAADSMVNTAVDSMANTAADSLERAGVDVPCQITFPDAQWTICQSKNGAGLGAKGGHNAEPHNHNDIGCFFYLNGEDFLLADFGCGEYTKEYFAEGRYDYFCCRSLGHSVPLIDGKEQLPGEAYRCDRFETDGNGKTIISFGQAYGNPGLRSLVRTLDWNGENGSLRVEDAFETTHTIKSVTENLVTGWKPRIEGNTIRIQGGRRSCLITVDGSETEIICTPEDFPDHHGIHRQVWRIQWQVPVKTEHCMADTKAAEYRRLQACFTVEAL